MSDQSDLFHVARNAPVWTFLTRPQLATRWKVSVKTIERMIADGLPVAVHGGGGHPDRIDPAAADAWRAAKEATRQTAQGSTGVVSLEAARTRKEISIAERNEMEIRRRRGELVDVTVVEQNWVSDSVAIRQRLRAIPRALAPQLVTAAAQGTKAVRALLGEAIDKVLAGLAGDGNGNGRKA